MNRKVFAHLCASCARRDKCPIGLQVNEGTLDEYVKGNLLATANNFSPDDLSVYVVVSECVYYEEEEVNDD